MNVGRDNAARIRHNLALCTSRCRNAVLYDNADYPQGIHMTLQFNELGLAAPLTQAVADAGYENTTLVQAQAIPAALAGKDLLVSAQTGSGKTAAFLRPSMQKLLARSEKPGKGPRVLVLTPTRELAQQVEKNAQQYGEKMRWLRTVTRQPGEDSPQGRESAGSDPPIQDPAHHTHATVSPEPAAPGRHEDLTATVTDLRGPASGTWCPRTSPRRLAASLASRAMAGDTGPRRATSLHAWRAYRSVPTTQESRNRKSAPVDHPARHP